ncbi:MAG: hypothetical protein L0323_16025 [Planctomycetes bacterium]|nr:hypothetical protein [Planctomycetota bacterium]
MDDLRFLPPNGGAYEQIEMRSGPPLSYVAEKLRHALEAVHRELLAGTRESPNLRESLLNGLTAYLALHNMLGLTRESRWFDRVAGLSRRGFGNWLARIAGAGSVRG